MSTTLSIAIVGSFVSLSNVGYGNKLEEYA